MLTSFYEILLTGTIPIGLYIGIVLLFISKHNLLLNRLLAFIVLTLSIFYCLVLGNIRNWEHDFIVLIRTFLPIYYFIPAACYLYLRAFIQDEARLSKKDLWHIAPLAVHFLYSMPVTAALLSGSLSWQQILETAEQHNQHFFNYGPIPDQFHGFFRLGLAMFYIFLGWRLFLSHQYRDFAARNRKLYTHAVRWIAYYLTTISTFGIFSLVLKTRFVFFNVKMTIHYGDAVSLFSLISFDLLVAYAAFNPVILFGLPHFRSAALQDISSAPSQSTIPELTQIAPDHPSKKVFESEVEKIEELVTRIDQYIINHTLKQNKKFTVRELSMALDIPQHHLLYIFKVYLQKSLVEHRNELRVIMVKEALSKGLANQLTIESIGEQAGFNSRASFFQVFKKYTGLTPTQFLKNSAADRV